MNMKKVLSMLLSVAMILNSLPLTVFATETECTHHTTHTEECGYVEAQEEIPCSHEHGECSYVEAKEEILCTCSETDATDALVHIEGCGYQVAVEAVECDHIHDENCGYKAAVEGVLCSFVCEECKIEQKLKQEPTELLTITVWSWVDEYEILSEDGTYATLPNAADWETLKSVLPASITAMVDGAEVEIPVQWECETFPTEGEGQGTYELKAILPEGYALDESVSALKLEVDLGVADQFADGTTWDGTTVATAYAGGTGTETDPYIIATAGQLIYLRDKVNSGTSYNGKYFRLDADLDMAGKTFGDAIGNTIGNTKNYNPRNFNGHFDGNHHKISNLTIGDANGYSALFGNVGWNNQEVVIKNLTLVNVNANRTLTNYGAAALVGNAGYLKLENCTVESGTVQTNSYTAGGFVANAGAYNAISLTIIDCVNKANITQTSSTGNGAGGIVGQGCNQSGNGNTTITGCINYGDVSGRSYAAGIIGNAYVATIEKCANYGAISAIGTSNGTYQKTAKAAGILVSGADKVTSIKNCYNVGNISSNGTTAYGSATQNAGGAAGIAAFNSSSSVQKTITDCHNVGTVTSDYGYPIGLRSKSITNAFYLNKPSQNNSAATQMTAEKFADGTVYNLLSANNPDVWGQTIGTDSYPVFYNGKNTPVIKEKVTITATAVNGEYNGSAHAGYKDVSTADTYNTAALVVTYVGRDGTTHADSATKPTNAGKYTVTIAIPSTDETYTGSVSVDFEITAKEIGITWSNTELTYNGQEQAPTATATKLIDGDTCTITVTGGKTNAGTNYSAEATAVSNPNYKLPKDGVATTFAIKTAEITEVKLTADSDVFTGSAQTPEITSVKAGELALTASDYTVSYKNSAGQTVTEMKNVGTYKVVVTAAENSNFYGSKEVEWKITKKQPTITTVPTATDITYGQTLAYVTLAGGVASVEGTFAFKDMTIAPTVADSNSTEYTLVFTPEDTDNYDPVETTVKVTVNPKEISIIWGTTEFTYDGTAQLPTAAVAESSVINGDQLGLTVALVETTEGAGTNAGTYNAKVIGITGDKAGNYKLPTTDVTTVFAIKAAEITDVTLAVESAVFTGSTQTPEITSVKAGELTLADRDYTGSYKDSAGQPVTEMKNVGTYTVVVTANNGSNFSGSKEVEWKITKKTIDSVNINVTDPVGGAAPDTNAGTGEGYSASEVTWSPSVSDKFVYNTIYTASVTLTANDNHQFASELYVEGWNKTVNADGTVTLTKEFTTASAKITSVTSPSDVTLTEHKVDADAVIAGLPTNVAIAAEDGTRSLPISWVLKANTSYNPAPKAVNEFTWTAEAGELDANGQTLAGTIKVTNPAPTAVSITAKENPKTVVYDGSAIDLSTLFEFDENVGLATYTVTPIDESAGSLNGSVLTITKAGKFTITVNTAANGIYGAGVATMTLNVNKANGSATITMENWTTGETAKAPVVTSETNDVSAATYLYESTDGKGYSNAAVPTAVGKYKVTAVLPSNDLYNEVAVSVDFEIKARTIIDSIFDWFDREDEEDDRVSITIAGDEKSIKAKATVSGKTATVLAPSAAQLNKIIAKTVETGTVEIDLSSLDKDISKVNLPIKTLKAIVKAAEELGNDTEAMKVLLPNGLAAEFDDKALRAIIDQVKCDHVSLVVEKTGTKRLNSKQKAALSELDVYGGYEAYLYCPKANKRISDFKGGIATLSVPFTVPAGKSAENFSVWYVSDSGKLEQLSTWYSGKKVNWDVSHFSDFIIAYNANTVVKENPNTGAF